MGAGAKAAGQRRADRDAVGDEIENRRRRYNVCVQPTTLDPAIAARGPPLRAPAASLRSAAPIEPTNPWNAYAPGIATEEEGDVGDASSGREHRRPRP